MISKMLCFLLIMMVALTSVCCAPLTTDKEAQLVYNYRTEGKGNYFFSFKTSNGITRDETGTLVNEGLPDEHISVVGSYSYINPDGKEVSVSYMADENGFITLLPTEGDIYRSDALLASLLG